MKKVLTIIMTVLCMVCVSYAGDPTIIREGEWLDIKGIAYIRIKADTLYVSSNIYDEVLEVGITSQKPKFRIHQGMFIPPCMTKRYHIGRTEKLLIRLVTKDRIQKVNLYIVSGVATACAQ